MFDNENKTFTSFIEEYGTIGLTYIMCSNTQIVFNLAPMTRELLVQRDYIKVNREEKFYKLTEKGQVLNDAIYEHLKAIGIPEEQTTWNIPIM